MHRAFLLLPCLLLVGCSRSQQVVDPQNPPEPKTSAAFETVAQVGSEIDRQYPLSGPQPTTTQIITVVFQILDNAQNPKTVTAVKDWANMALEMGKNLPQNDADRAGNNSLKWLIAAADTKKPDLIGKAAPSGYEAARKAAFLEAARGDSLARP